MAAAPWPRPGSVPVLPAGAVHFWFTNLDAERGRLASYQSLLSPDEAELAGRFKFEEDAGRYAVCRGVLRSLLAAYTSDSPGGIVFRYGAHGKPDVAGPVRFNVSHSGGLALLAFTRAAEIGVDVERVHELPDLDRMMAANFAAGERDAIRALPPGEERLAAFFRCWTRKEAVLKALGWGLALALDSFEVTVSPGDARLLSDRSDAAAPGRWRLLPLAPAPGVIGAAAWSGGQLEAECFAWPA